MTTIPNIGSLWIDPGTPCGSRKLVVCDNQMKSRSGRWSLGRCGKIVVTVKWFESFKLHSFFHFSHFSHFFLASKSCGPIDLVLKKGFPFECFFPIFVPACRFWQTKHPSKWVVAVRRRGIRSSILLVILVWSQPQGEQILGKKMVKIGDHFN